MKQRLGIAAALISNPSFLILDEPANGLDPFGIQELRELIRSFPEKGITVLVSSHILSEVEQTADHIGILSGGRLGAVEERRYRGVLQHLLPEYTERRRESGDRPIPDGGKIL